MRIGLIVNPIAGMGGRVALKGTDGADTVVRAAVLGATPTAGERAMRFLKRLAVHGATPEILTLSRRMGADAVRTAGLACEVLPIEIGETTSAEDTRRGAPVLQAAGADLIVFAGGDGTARDIVDAVGTSLPILGIPSGVKMHSGVFGATPEAAALLVSMVIAGDPRIALEDREVMDIDEAELRKGHLAARLYGLARVPYERRLVQAGKARSPAASTALAGAAREIASMLAPGTLYLLGPGTSAGLVKSALGFDGTLLGVDVVLDGKLIGRDVTERQILEIALGRPVKLILGLIGGQGFLLGRGNQQLSPEVIRRAGRDGLIVLASTEKLLALDGAPLLVDTGDADLDAGLAGYIRIASGAGETTVMRIASPPIQLRD